VVEIEEVVAVAVVDSAVGRGAAAGHLAATAGPVVQQSSRANV
jgi:hypothetical protein